MGRDSSRVLKLTFALIFARSRLARGTLRGCGVRGQNEVTTSLWPLLPIIHDVGRCQGEEKRCRSPDLIGTLRPQSIVLWPRRPVLRMLYSLASPQTIPEPSVANPFRKECKTLPSNHFRQPSHRLLAIHLAVSVCEPPILYRSFGVRSSTGNVRGVSFHYGWINRNIGFRSTASVGGSSQSPSAWLSSFAMQLSSMGVGALV